MIKPYIGVTGFMNREEVATILGAFPKNATHKLMVGVLASSKTLNGRQNKYPKRYPPVEQISTVFFDHSQAFNLIHYNTDHPEDLFQQLKKLTELGGPNLHGFQLNIAWPSAWEVGTFKRIFPGQKIILQISRQAMEELANNSRLITNKIKQYLEPLKVIDAILLDSSGGKGLPGNFSFYQDCIDRLTNLEIGIGIAGGLTAETLCQVEKTFSPLHGLNLDAEGGLRDEQDNLDIKKAVAYLAKAQSMFNGWAKANQADITDYSYCPKHDIFFNHKSMIDSSICPLCLQDMISNRKYDPKRTLYQGSEDLSKA